MVFKFRIGDKVKTATNSVGEVKSCKYELNENNGVIIESKRYYVKFSPYDIRYIDEDKLKELHEFDFTKKFEIGLLNLLIDFYLSERNFDLVKKYVQLKREYEV
jgi:hypothetical protein